MKQHYFISSILISVLMLGAPAYTFADEMNMGTVSAPDESKDPKAKDMQMDESAHAKAVKKARAVYDAAMKRAQSAYAKALKAKKNRKSALAQLQKEKKKAEAQYKKDKDAAMKASKGAKK